MKTAPISVQWAGVIFKLIVLIAGVIAVAVLLSSCESDYETKRMKSARGTPTVDGSSVYVGGDFFRVFDFSYGGHKYRLFESGYASSIVEVKDE